MKSYMRAMNCMLLSLVNCDVACFSFLVFIY